MDKVADVKVVAGEIVHREVPRGWKSYLWDTFDKESEERKLLTKLDAAVLTFASLGYFIKCLDQANINNAFVSGMKEDLSLYGNELNYMTSAWTVGHVVGEIPSNIVLTRVRPSIWIPAMEITWSVLTMLLSRCKSPTQVYVLRFFIGLAESTFYPGMQYLIGSWYRKDELAKRSCIFHTSGAIATMISGYLMAAAYGLGGTGGLAGWRWRFIVDGVISLPIALAGFYFIPDFPENSRARYLSTEERVFAKKRMELEGRKTKEPYTKVKIKKILTSWHIYLLSLLYICFNSGNAGATPVMAHYLKDSKTQPYAWSSDTWLRGRRCPPVIFGGIVNIISLVSLAVWQIPEGWRWTCYYLAGFGGGLSGLTFAEAHEICSDDNEERAIVVATMNEMAYVVQAWLPLIVWQQTDAPQYRKGFLTVTCLSLLMIITALLIRPLHRREIRSLRNRVSSSSEEQIAVISKST